MGRHTRYEFICHAPKFTEEVLNALRARYEFDLVQVDNSTLDLYQQLICGGTEEMDRMFSGIASLIPDFTKITCRMFPCKWAPSEEPVDYVLFRGSARATAVRDLEWYKADFVGPAKRASTNCEFTVHGVELTNNVADAFHASSSWFKVSRFGQLIVLDVEVRGDRYSRMNELFTEIASITPTFTKITCLIDPGLHLEGKEYRTFQLNKGEKEAVPIYLPVKIEVMRRVTPDKPRE